MSRTPETWVVVGKKGSVVRSLAPKDSEWVAEIPFGALVTVVESKCGVFGAISHISQVSNRGRR